MVEKPTELLQAEETLDDLILGDLKVIQATRGYRFSIDAVLLAHFPELTGVNRAVDLGTGSGVIPLLLTARDPGVRILGVELQPDMANRARRSVIYNCLEDRIEIIHADIREIEKTLKGGSADLVLSNPPFWKQNEGYVSKRLEEAIARHEVQLNLDELVLKGAYLLKQGGKMAIIQRAQRLEEVLETFRRYKLFPQRLRLVHPSADRNANLLLLEGIKNKPSQLTIVPPLIIYSKPGEYSPAIKCMYGDGFSS